MKNFISLGAGVQSSVMALMAAKGEITPMPDGAIFADTGAEPKAIYEYLDWLETQLSFPVYRVSAGNLEEKIKDQARNKNAIGPRLGAPPFFSDTEGRAGMLFRQCTKDFKIIPIEKKIRELMGLGFRKRSSEKCSVWIGISTDEATRMKDSDKKYKAHRWPLIEARMSREDCLAWMRRYKYPEPSKSSCVFCPYHDDRMWRDIKLNQPDEFRRAVEIDRLIRNGVRGTTRKLYLHRSLTPLEDVDFRNLEDIGQLNLFENECDGMCGL